MCLFMPLANELHYAGAGSLDWLGQVTAAALYSPRSRDSGKGIDFDCSGRERGAMVND